MNRTEMIEHVADQAKITKAAAGRALDAVLGGITGTLVAGGEVQLQGFGRFHVTKRDAWTGHNPKTREPMDFPAVRQAKFKPAKHLRDELNG